VVAVAVAAAWTLLPAGLVVLGPRIRRGTLPGAAPTVARTRWRRWIDRVIAHPLAFLVPGLLGLAVLARMPHFSWKLKLAIPMALWFTREVSPIMKEESLVSSSITKKPRPDQTLTVPWVDILRDAQDGLLALSVRIGLQVLQEMMATDVEPWAGSKGRHNAHRQAVRHGTEAGSVYLGDRQIAITHPRLRATDGLGEIPGETYHPCQDPALATQTVLERMLYGLASRQQVHADAAW